MSEKPVLENFRYYLENLDTSPPRGAVTGTATKSPRAIILLILLNEGPQTVLNLKEKSGLIMSQFHTVYHEMIQLNLLAGPVWTGDIMLTNDGTRLAQLQSEL